VSGADLARLAELIDATAQTDDFVTGVVGLAGGWLGGEVEGERSWYARIVARARHSRFGQRHVTQGLAAEFGPEQLRKAAVEARRLVFALDAMRLSGDDVIVALVGRLDELSIASMPDELMSVAVPSADLHALHRRLAQATSAMIETRTRLVIAVRRSPEA
jgi:hypothetical protein